jgi:hypothetical protein
MIWAMYGTARILNANGFTALGARYRGYVDYMATTLRTVFWDATQSGFMCVSDIANITLPPTSPQQSYTNDGGCVLDDPYEGELIAVFGELYGGLTPAEADAMWTMKRGKLQATTYVPPAGTGFGNITVQKGYARLVACRCLLRPHMRFVWVVGGCWAIIQTALQLVVLQPRAVEGSSHRLALHVVVTVAVTALLVASLCSSTSCRTSTRPSHGECSSMASAREPCTPRRTASLGCSRR